MSEDRTMRAVIKLQAWCRGIKQRNLIRRAIERYADILENEFGFEVLEKNMLSLRCWINEEYDAKLQEYIELQDKLKSLTLAEKASPASHRQQETRLDHEQQESEES